MTGAGADLERRLGYRYSRQAEWAALASGSTLFDLLRAAVAEGTAPRALELIEGWRSFVEESVTRIDPKGAEETHERWERMKALAWCADEAIAHPYGYEDQSEWIRFGPDGATIGSAPTRVRSDPSWGWSCVRSLLGREARVGRPVRITAAGWNEGEGDDGGFLVTLVLEIMKGGESGVAHLPRDTLSTLVGSDFSASMAGAWSAAKATVRAAGTQNSPITGRLRILRRGEPAGEAVGRSASGAAARGWWFALLDRVPDDGVVVMAEAVLGEADEVTWKSVDGVAAKVKAIAAEPIYDTILVADEDSQRAAVKTLIELGASDRVRVVPIR